MADDWQPGDLALCANDGVVICDCGGSHRHNGGLCPPLGSCRTVAEVALQNENWIGHVCSSPVLYFTDATAGLAVRFRKIRPHTPDAEDAETIALLTGAPVPEPVQ